MIKRLKVNENLRKLSYFKTKGNVDPTRRSAIVNDKVATPEMLEQVRNRVIEEGGKDRKRTIFVLIFSVLVAFAVILSVLYLISFS